MNNPPKIKTSTAPDEMQIIIHIGRFFLPFSNDVLSFDIAFG